MTLLELLRQELPKRGGWPEGVNFIAQDIDGFVAGYKCKPISSHNGIWGGDGYLNDSGWWSKVLTSDRETAIVTHEQYEETGWDGTGLPPVGIDVEFTIGTYDIETDFDGILPPEGEIVEVIAHKTTSDGNDVAVVYWDDKGVGRSACFAPGRLRPLRTGSSAPTPHRSGTRD